MSVRVNLREVSKLDADAQIGCKSIKRQRSAAKNGFVFFILFLFQRFFLYRFEHNVDKQYNDDGHCNERHNYKRINAVSFVSNVN